MHLYVTPSTLPQGFFIPLSRHVPHIWAHVCVCEPLHYRWFLHSPSLTPLTVHHVLDQAPEWVLTQGDRVSWIVIDNSPSRSTVYSVAVCTQHITMLTHSDSGSIGTQSTGEWRPAVKFRLPLATKPVFSTQLGIVFCFMPTWQVGWLFVAALIWVLRCRC